VVRIGNQTAFCSSTVLEPYEYALANRFDAFEWFPDKRGDGQGWGPDDLDAASRRVIMETAVSHDVRLSVHAPWESCPAEHLLARSIVLCRDVGARLLVIHLNAGDGIVSFADSVAALIRQLAHERILLAVENTPFTSPEDFNRLFRILLDSGLVPDHAGMCFDLGHANLCASTRNDYILYLDKLGPHVPIIHVHAHENYGDGDTHLTLFTGPARLDESGILGFVSRLKARRFSGSVILEQWPHPHSLLNHARERLLRLFAS
jgi:sugar phosphate isomerase/epimerase